LIAAASGAQREGQALVHFDVRSDNVCFDGGRTILLDWPDACRGNPLIDVVGWLPSLALEGGPPPKMLVGTAATELVVLVGGYWAARAPSTGERSDGVIITAGAVEGCASVGRAVTHLPQPDGPAGAGELVPSSTSRIPGTLDLTRVP
jgi:Ser/Thr protein kinase RdoA (MazF antagonist)